MAKLHFKGIDAYAEQLKKAASRRDGDDQARGF